MIPAILPLVLLAVAGLRDIAGLVPGRVRIAAGIMAALVVVPDLLAAAHVTHKLDAGNGAAVRAILERGPPKNTLVLHGSSGWGESSLTAALADQDRDRRLLMGRGLKICATGDFLGTNYEMRFQTAAEAGTAIEQLAVAFVVIDTSSKAAQRTHNLQLLEAAKLRGWSLIARFPRDDNGENLVYEIDRNHGKPADMAALIAYTGKPSPF